MGMVSRQYVHCSQASFIHALDWLSVCFCICIQVFSILVSLQGTVFSETLNLRRDRAELIQPFQGLRAAISLWVTCLSFRRAAHRSKQLTKVFSRRARAC